MLSTHQRVFAYQTCRARDCPRHLYHSAIEKTATAPPGPADQFERGTSLRGSSGRRLLLALLFSVTLYALAGFLLVPILIERQIVAGLAPHVGGEVAVGDVRVNPFALRATVDRLTVGGPDAMFEADVARIVWRRTPSYLVSMGRQVSTLSLASLRLTVHETAGFRSAVAGALSDPEHVSIGQLTITDGEFTLLGESGLRIRIASLQVAAQNLGAGQPGEFTVTGRVGQGGMLTADGTLQVAPMSLDSTVQLAGIDLADIDPERAEWALPTSPALTITSGVLAGQARVRLDRERIDSVGDFAIGQVYVIDTASGQRVLGAKEISATALALRGAPLTVSAQQLRVSGPQWRLQRAADGTLAGAEWLGLLVPGQVSVIPASERLEIVNGRVEATDFAVTPPARFDVNDISGSVSTIRGGSTVRVSLTGQVGTGTRGRLDASWETTDPARLGLWRIAAEDLDATRLSPYLTAVANREITDGRLDLTTNGAVADGVLTVTHSVASTGLRLAALDETPEAPDNALDLAIALLENADGRLRVDISLVPVRLDEAAPPLVRLRDGFNAAVMRVTESPFSVLGTLLGSPNTDLVPIGFEPGSAAVTETAAERLERLAEALRQRPRLGIEVGGRYDPVADRAALARQQINLHIALATSVGPPDRAAQTTLNLSEPRVNSVLEEFAGERLRPPTIAAIRARFAGTGPEYYQALYDALVAHESVSGRALKNLARFRAQSVIGELSAQQINPERIVAGGGAEKGDERNGRIDLAIAVRPPGR